ncbi:MAG TPA: phage tail sheath C-terminal domain-containing protein [Haliangium sp.]|nr:phage tail sheath C-terminal domain-containing protein [Haliangium sp.]
MPTYKTPGVYVEEISTLPPSVAEVATAIPAFIGTTASGAAGKVEVYQCSTMLEYELRFGKPEPTEFEADAAGNIEPLDDPMPKWPMWYALSLYYKNGGGRCYVVSVDNHASGLSKARFEAGLAALEREDEPTLLVMPELVSLAQADFDDLCQQALAQCKKLGDRFAILDVKDGDVEKSRQGYGADNLEYGAAYYPNIQTTLTHAYDETKVTIGSGNTAATLASLKSSNTALYNQIKKNLAEQRVELPPSAAVAGIYARVDRERGVWKAPANVGVMSAIGPTMQITHDEQESLNIEPTSGKSINAIRSFAGRGTLIWGARTLAGNDNEWRYVSVRRLFIMIEESAKKATAFSVFEANDATTWLKVKGMLESYLYGLWEQGALQGAAPEAAYYVNVGLGRTMSPRDVLEGRMIVELGVAAVRPAEFIVLRFSHKMAEA